MNGDYSKISAVVSIFSIKAIITLLKIIFLTIN